MSGKIALQVDLHLGYKLGVILNCAQGILPYIISDMILLQIIESGS